MAQRIIWTSKAEETFSEILLFYYKRNGNKIYSRKLHSNIIQIINTLKDHPYLGRKTKIEDIRAIVTGNFRIFYKIKPEEIVILLITDCRQNPQSFNL